MYILKISVITEAKEMQLIAQKSEKKGIEENVLEKHMAEKTFKSKQNRW